MTYLPLLAIIGYIMLNLTAIIAHGAVSYGSLRDWWQS